MGDDLGDLPGVPPGNSPRPTKNKIGKRALRMILGPPGVKPSQQTKLTPAWFETGGLNHPTRKNSWGLFHFYFSFFCVLVFWYLGGSGVMWSGGLGGLWGGYGGGMGGYGGVTPGYPRLPQVTHLETPPAAYMSDPCLMKIAGF